ncbi:heavy-metal-associated domain-containing protein [Paenibacillus tarimensis]
MKSVCLQVEGMSCDLCGISIEKVLRAIGSTGEADVASATITVEYDEHKISLEKIKQSIQEQGYKVI